MGAEEAALKFSRRELTSSVFDFSRVGFRITSAPAVMMLPVERIHFVVILLYCFFPDCFPDCLFDFCKEIRLSFRGGGGGFYYFSGNQLGEGEG